MKLSPHFTLAELCASNVANALGIDNIAKDPKEIDALKHLAVTVLEPIRARFGPFSPTSGYRSKAVNEHPKVQGSKTSAHLKGEAADVSIRGVLPITLAKWCVANLKDFDQIIWEPTWVHIGIRKQGNRRQVLRATVGSDGKMKYAPVQL